MTPFDDVVLAYNALFAGNVVAPGRDDAGYGAGAGDGGGSGDGHGFGMGSGCGAGDGSGYDGDIALVDSRSADIGKAGLFLMLFAQFEWHINRRCEILIRDKRALPDWRDRRAWEQFDAGRVRDIPFKRRLALVMDRGRPMYAQAAYLYQERNDLAHGVKMVLEFDVRAAADALKSILADLEPIP